MGAIKTLLTFAEFERMETEQPGKTELLEGELSQLPPPEKKHALIAKRLFLPLNREVEESKKSDPSILAGEVFQEMGFLLGRNPGSWLVYRC